VANFQSIECDVLTADGRALCTVQLPVIPRVSDELDIDLGGRAAGDGLYRVVRVRYHVRPRKFTTRDDLFGVSVFVEPVG
jgi:hypothetical protein